MTIGDIIGDYRLVTEFASVNCSTGAWAFAERRNPPSEEMFIKRFMSPKYPFRGSSGGDASRQQQLQRCEWFEAQQVAILNALERVAKNGGSVVGTIDFFREAAFYYKVTEKIDSVGLDVKAISALKRDDTMTLLLTLAHTLGELHAERVIHGDLKPANVLVKRTKDSYAAKVIDFDGSYIEGASPRPESLQGDFPYFSPEQAAYVVGGGPGGSSLTTASDVFTAGIIFTEYLTGRKPDFDTRRFRYLCEAVAGGNFPEWPKSPKISEDLRDLVLAMLAADSRTRPSMKSVHTRLMELNSGLPRASSTHDRPASHLVGRGFGATPDNTRTAGTQDEIVGKGFGR